MVLYYSSHPSPRSMSWANLDFSLVCFCSIYVLLKRVDFENWLLNFTRPSLLPYIARAKQNKNDISFTATVSELTRGGSTGAGGKGHVKSASVSSPGPSAADNGAAPDPLGPRYLITKYKNIQNTFVLICSFFFLFSSGFCFEFSMGYYCGGSFCMRVCLYVFVWNAMCYSVFAIPFFHFHW